MGALTRTFPLAFVCAHTHIKGRNVNPVKLLQIFKLKKAEYMCSVFFSGVSPHVGVAETNEGGLAAHDIQPKKQLAGPTGMILLYTALIVLFIAGIVVITVWKQPFHGWLVSEHIFNTKCKSM